MTHSLSKILPHHFTYHILLFDNARKQRVLKNKLFYLCKSKLSDDIIFPEYNDLHDKCFEMHDVV